MTMSYSSSGLVQDLHQPLHTGFGADDHGRRISVQYHDDPSTNLYDFWERDVVDTQRGGSYSISMLDFLGC